MKTCFIIMPFATVKGQSNLTKIDLDFIYENKIKKAVLEFEYQGEKYFDEVVRYEEKVGSIVKGIVQKLQNADLVIADLTGLNPNVMYELGVRHSLKRGTIMLTQDFSTFPSDLRDYFAIEYHFTKDIHSLEIDYNNFKIDLHKAMNEVFTTNKPDSPVLDVLKTNILYKDEEEIISIKEQIIILKSFYTDLVDLQEIIEGFKADKNILKNKPNKAFIEIMTLLVNSLRSKLGLVSFKVSEKYLFVDIEMTKNFLDEIVKVLQMDDYLQVSLNLPENENPFAEKTVEMIFDSEYIDPVFLRKKRDIRRIKLANAFTTNEFIHKEIFNEAIKYLAERAEKLECFDEVENLIKTVNPRE